MRIRIVCPVCEAPGSLPAASAGAWQCPACDHLVTPAGPSADGPLAACAVCGNHELYRKKDFPHALGMLILVGAFVGSTVAYWLYDWWLTWAILLGSAAFDGLLYLYVKDVLVCYRCNAEYRRGTREPAWPPFELTVHERYRQEKIRQQQLQAQAARPSSIR